MGARDSLSGRDLQQRPRVKLRRGSVRGGAAEEVLRCRSKCVPEVARALEAVLAVLGEGSQHHGVEARDARTGWRGRLVDVLIGHSDRVIGGERWLADEQLEEE